MVFACLIDFRCKIPFGGNPMFRKMYIIGSGLLVTLGASYMLLGQTTPQTTRQTGEIKVDEKEAPKVSTEKPMSFWMSAKLSASKSIFEALAKGDFEKLESNAEHMRLIGKLEGFVRRKNPDYKTQLQTFELANQEIVRQAKRHNAEGAALAFNQLTTSCVACHVMLREGIE
jgi:cytochrome c556